MPYVVKDRVKVTSTTTGNGAFTLGSAVSGFQDFSVIGDGNQTYYCITDNTNWEVGIGTYTASGTTLSRDTIYESSNNDDKVDWGAGTKTVFVTFPAETTQGSVPKGDNSSVGTNLYAWNNLKKQLDAEVINGVPYANANTNGMMSTFSLVLTGSSSYSGGVLAPNGDIHFVPTEANRGQKISSTGVVSTYSLVYTATTNILKYRGGVLDPSGNIHFIPYDAAVGQRVSPAGTVSTYSLTYTTADAYYGGVLAANGDVFFVPFDAAVGQKVSASGVVSTYALAYTLSGGNAYAGGVLAPNGDIHFVPHSARVGQKISATGVVSTYSLVYTIGVAYIGGVLSPNGDIHFIPYNAAVGQKISINGTVSTYSLVTTTTVYAGGVLAPNGDIHFIPREVTGSNTIARGQKVSASGVVSTYSLVYNFGTSGVAYEGGVLAPNGNIYFINFSSGIGQKISTNTTRPIGYCLSPFFNKL
jgi:hypothetical protein